MNKQLPVERGAPDQSWQGMDGATAWHLIDRHAEDWAAIGRMMAQWLEANNCSAMLEFVLANGVPMCRNGQYRYHGVTEPIWHETPKAAIQAAMRDFHAQQHLNPTPLSHHDS